MKTQEELTKLKNEYKALTNKLKELNDEELEKVIGGLATREKEQSGDIDQQLLEILLNSKTPMDLINNLEFLDKINQKNIESIEQSGKIKENLEGLDIL